MKKPTQYILSLVTILLVIIACTKQVGLYTEVEFELTEAHESDGYVNRALATAITVTPEELVEGYSYSYSYKINNGSGYFEDESGTTISEGEKIALNPLTASITYLPTEVGDHTIVFTAEDSFGFTEQVIVTYSISDIPVTWTASASTDQILLGDSETISVVLGSETEDEEVTYQRNYSFADGTGTLTTSEGADETLDELVEISPGTYELEFTATELGSVTIEFLLEDSNGQEVIETISFEVVEELDTTAPVITLVGESEITLTVGDVYVDEGATATDDIDGDLTSEIVTVNPVDTSVAGEYTITYNVEDQAENNATEVIRIVTVVEELDTTAPVITLTGESEITLTVGDVYVDEGATATDDIDGDLTIEIETVNPVDTSVAGEYTITYNVDDQAENNATEVIRIVTVVEEADTTAPVITLVGESEITLTVGDVYVDEGATATDDIDGNLTSEIETVNPVDTSVAGEYTITYNVEDQAENNATEVIRTVIVIDVNQAPVAIASSNVSTGTASLKVQFTGSNSTDDGDQLYYLWDFGDGSTSIEADPLHSFTNAGEYEVLLTVSDDESPSLSDSDTITITVSEPTPTATFSNGSFIDDSSDSSINPTSGILTIENGAISFDVVAYTFVLDQVITGVVIVTFEITTTDGTLVNNTQSTAIPDAGGISETTETTPEIPEGIYNYSITVDTGGDIGGAQVVPN